MRRASARVCIHLSTSSPPPDRAIMRSLMGGKVCVASIGWGLATSSGDYWVLALPRFSRRLP